MPNIEKLQNMINTNYLIEYLNSDPEEKPDEKELFRGIPLVNASKLKEFIDKKYRKH
jgi:hypothetical protein